MQISNQDDLNKYFYLLDFQLHGSIILTNDFEVLFWNKKLEEWSGLKREEILGKNLLEQFEHLASNKFKVRIEEVFKGSPPAVFSAKIHKTIIPSVLEDGAPRVQQATLVKLPLIFNNKPLAIFNIEDVSGLSHKIDAYKKLSKEKDQFLSICSHDLRSPLNGILAFSEMLQEEPNLTKENIEDLQRIHKSGELLLNLINDLLAISQEQSNKKDDFQEVNISEVIRESIASLYPIGQRKKIQINLSEHQPEVLVLGSPLSLLRVFNNLLSNAIKFTPAGKSITVDISKLEGEIIIKVIDQGIGISKENLEFIFNSFTKASREGTQGEKSTGLGLYITQRIINLHRGRIDVESTIGHGSTFTVKLPAL